MVLTTAVSRSSRPVSVPLGNVSFTTVSKVATLSGQSRGLQNSSQRSPHVTLR